MDEDLTLKRKEKEQKTEEENLASVLYLLALADVY